MAKQIGNFITTHWQWLLSAFVTAVAALVIWSFTAGVFITETRMEISGIKDKMAEMSGKLDEVLDGRQKPRQAVAKVDQ